MLIKILTMFVAITFAGSLYAEKEDTKKKLDSYSRLIAEAKKQGFELEGLSPQNIEKYSYVLIQFADKKKETQFYYLQKKIYFIQHSSLYPSLDNLLKTALSDNKKNDIVQITAWRILASTPTKFEKNKPTTNQVTKFIENSKNNAIISEAIPVLVKIDEAKGFAVADKFIKSKKVSLKDKVRLSMALMPYGYTGGYVILKDALNSKEHIIKSNTRVLVNYYQQYNGSFATNTKITIDTATMKDQ